MLVVSVSSWSFCSVTVYGRDRQGVKESISIFKGECATIDQWPAIVNKAVIVANTFKDLGVDEANRAEPPTAKVDPGYITASDTHVHYLNGVSRYATWKWSCRSLVYHNICLGTLLSPYSIGFLSCQCCVKQIQTRKRPALL